MNKNEIDKSFVSEYDVFLRQFDATHEKTASQQKEINKHERIAKLRDGKASDTDSQEIWEDF